MLRGACRGPLVQGPVRVTAPAGHDQQRAWLTGALTAAGLATTTTGGTEIHLVGYGDPPGALSSTAVVTVAMDLPTVLSRATSPVRVATYSATQPSMAAVAAVLAGTATAPGRSPVDVPGLPRSACRS